MCFSELFGDTLTTEGFQGFDVVVSNPPYLTQSQAQEPWVSGQADVCIILVQIMSDFIDNIYEMYMEETNTR